MLPFLLLLLCTLQLADSTQCLRCRRFGNADTVDFDKLVMNHLKTEVETCAETAEECDHDKCYSIQYTNATTGTRGEVRDCLGKYAFGYWKEKHVTGKLVDKGADKNSFTNWYTCSGELCNNEQDKLNCPNDPAGADPNGTYVVMEEKMSAVCKSWGNESTYTVGGNTTVPGGRLLKPSAAERVGVVAGLVACHIVAVMMMHLKLW